MLSKKLPARILINVPIKRRNARDLHFESLYLEISKWFIQKRYLFVDQSETGMQRPINDQYVNTGFVFRIGVTIAIFTERDRR